MFLSVNTTRMKSMAMVAGWGIQQINKKPELQWGPKLNPVNKTQPQTILSMKQKYINWNIQVLGTWKWDRRGVHQIGANMCNLSNFTCLTDFVYLLLTMIFYGDIKFTFYISKYIISLEYIMYTVLLWMKFYSFTSSSFVNLPNAIFCHCSYDTRFVDCLNPVLTLTSSTAIELSSSWETQHEDGNRASFQHAFHSF
jgi:hypothetical protein